MLNSNSNSFSKSITKEEKFNQSQKWYLVSNGIKIFTVNRTCIPLFEENIYKVNKKATIRHQQTSNVHIFSNLSSYPFQMIDKITKTAKGSYVKIRYS